jgi:hypothetical protein
LGNPYTYAGNDPVNRYDPLGEISAPGWLKKGAGYAWKKGKGAAKYTGKYTGGKFKDAWEYFGDKSGDLYKYGKDKVKSGAKKAWDLAKSSRFITYGFVILDLAITWSNPLNWLMYYLDQLDNTYLNVLSFGLKFLMSPQTTGLSTLIGLTFWALGDVEEVRFKNGMLVFEWDPSGRFNGMVFGGTAHLRGGTADHPFFKHELYHSYQYAGYHDWFLPAYVLMGGWGLISSAIEGEWQGRNCFGGVSDERTYGNPLEWVAETFYHNSSYCH